MSNIIETLREGNLKLEIWYDDAGESPRNFDSNACVFWSDGMHRRYNFHEAAASEMLDELRDLVPEDAKEEEDEDWDDIKVIRWLMRNQNNDSDYAVMPVYMYDHSGLSFSTGSFSCPWDSGVIGFFMTNRKRFEELGLAWSAEKGRENIQSEVKIFDEYHVYGVKGFTVTEYETCGACSQEHEKESDSCGGFYGAEYAEEMKHNMPEKFWPLLERV